MHRQARAAMIFNGHTSEYLDALDEETWAEIEIMFDDGVIGNKGILRMLGDSNHIAATLYMSKTKHPKPVKMRDMMRRAFDYCYYDAAS